MSGVRVFVVVGLLVLAAVAAGTAWSLSRGDDDPDTPLTVVWGGSEGHPCCTYDATSKTVEAELLVDGEAPPSKTVRVTVTAYADENTSVPVGSSSRSVRVDGTVHQTVVVSIPVTKVPHFDDDGIVACRLEWK